MGSNTSKRKPISSDSIGCILAVLTIIGVFIYFIVTRYCLDNVSPFVSEYDGNKYDVRKVGNIRVRTDAANYLARINERINYLVHYMYSNGLPDPETAGRLYHRWRTIELKETSSIEKSAAYTLNKSTEIRLCIRNKKGEFEDLNTSMFVILHELAHVMSISYNHTEEFKNNFSYITHLASGLGIYMPQDFTKKPRTYCGVNINTTPCANNSCDYNTIKE